jgi:hypothetical protein
MVAHRRPRACLALARKRTGIRASAAYDQAAYALRKERSAEHLALLLNEPENSVGESPSVTATPWWAAPLRPLPIPTGFSWAAGISRENSPKPWQRSAVCGAAVAVGRPGRDALRLEFTSVVGARRCNRNAGSQVTGSEFAAGAPAGMMSSCGFRVRVGPGSNRRARVQGLGVFGGTGRG